MQMEANGSKGNRSGRNRLAWSRSGTAWQDMSNSARSKDTRPSNDTRFFMLNHSSWHQIMMIMMMAAIAFLVVPLHAARVHTKQEYCEAETFRASCASNEVVVMESASYGRMKIGRCVIRDYGYVGCAADVLAHMDSRCSGRRSCEIRIPDSTLDRPNTCPGDFKTYLEASYGCVQVHTPLCRGGCRNSTTIQAESPGGYIASVSSEETGCGRTGCPWVLRAQPGQRLNITLLDFALSTRHRNAKSGGNSHLGLPEVCYTYATLWEKGMDKPKVVCGSRERASSVFMSETNEVRIEVTEGKRGGNFGYFLLMYQTVGCTELDPPLNTWIKKQEGSLTVGCPATGETWTVKCVDNAWDINIGTCPEGPSVFDPPMGSSSEDDAPSLPVGILITIILAIAMVIGVLILTVGLVMIKRRRQQQPGRERPLNQSTPSSDLYYKDGHSTVGRSQGYSTMEQKKYAQYKDKHKNNTGTAPGSAAFRREQQQMQENEYAYNRNMELRPLPSIPDMNAIDDGAPLDSGRTAGAPPGGGVPMFGPHGEGAYNSSSPSPPTPHHMNHEIPTYDHTYFTAPLPSSAALAATENGMVGPHYFELETEHIPLPPQPPLPVDHDGVGPLSSPLLVTGSRYPPRAPAPPAPSLRPLLSGSKVNSSTGPGHKSPEQENAENVGKETGHPDTMTMGRHHHPQSNNGQLPFQESSNCSWP